jgi:hypothetical protein
MTAYVRQRESQIVNGQLADAEDVAAEFNAIASAFETTYMRDNIIGAVSQNSGVPTGAIIESGQGSGDTGNFIKYADGTMIIYSSVNKSSSGIVSRGFPRDFVGVPRVFCQSANSTGFTISPFVAVISAPTNSSYSVNLYNFLTGGEVNGVIHVMAIGRWF